MSEPIMKVMCVEPEGEFLREVRLTELSMDRFRTIYQRLSQFDTLFNDYVKGDFQSFVSHFIINVEGTIEPAGLLWDVDDVGIFFMNEIKPCQSATAHFTFWDKRFRGREDLCRRMIDYVFDRYKLVRLETRVPVHAIHTIRAVESVGMKKEGVLRKACLYKGNWFNTNIYSVTDLERSTPGWRFEDAGTTNKVG